MDGHEPRDPQQMAQQRRFRNPEFCVTLRMLSEATWAANAPARNRIPVSEVTWLFCRPRFVTCEMENPHSGAVRWIGTEEVHVTRVVTADVLSVGLGGDFVPGHNGPNNLLPFKARDLVLRRSQEAGAQRLPCGAGCPILTLLL